MPQYSSSYEALPNLLETLDDHGELAQKAATVIRMVSDNHIIHSTTVALEERVATVTFEVNVIVPRLGHLDNGGYAIFQDKGRAYLRFKIES